MISLAQAFFFFFTITDSAMIELRQQNGLPREVGHSVPRGFQGNTGYSPEEPSVISQLTLL